MPRNKLNLNNTYNLSSTYGGVIGKDEDKARGDQSPAKTKPTTKKKAFKKPAPKVQVVEKVKFNFGKNKKS